MFARRFGVKRDMDLMRKILLRIEECSDVPPKVLTLDDFMDMKKSSYMISLHIDLLCDAGLIEVMDTSIEDGLKDFDIVRLTFAGYEYLDAIRNAMVWDRVKRSVSCVGGATLDIIKQLAVKELAKELGLNQ